MKESYGEGLASHTSPELCAGAREGTGEALAGVRAGRVLSRESTGQIGAPTPSTGWEGNIVGAAIARPGTSSARSKTSCTFGNSSRRNWETPGPALAKSAKVRVVRHIQKWLNAGVLEDGKRIQAEEGTPQGGSISPLLANIYLHYVFDLWADHWRKTQAHGDVVIVRYADDFVVGVQHRQEAERFWKDLRERFAQFNLDLHPDKTRLIEFGRYAAQRREEKGQGKPETFNFLGFTHSCGKTQQGKFIVLRRPMAKRMRAKRRELKEELRRRLHDPVAEAGKWLRSVVTGWMRYFAVPWTYDILAVFRRQVTWLWYRALRRRTQKSRMTWPDMLRLAETWLPAPRIYHPYPWERLRVRSKARAV